MTGIEMLRHLAQNCLNGSVNGYTTMVSSVHAAAIDAIADQIVREQGERVSRMRALAVVTEMERHVSGVEGAEDSPVARWARELREALGGDRRDHSAEVSVSAYDLLPQEDREAIAWVREHGGLEKVKKLLDWVVGHCSTEQQLDFDFWLSGRVMYALGFDEDMADRDEVERRLTARLMPEGMCWPVFEDGEVVRPGDKLQDNDGDWFEAVSLVFTCYWWSVRGYQTEGFGDLDDKTRRSLEGMAYGTRVKRPAPKVLDADGAEIRARDHVWHVETGQEYVVVSICYKDGIVVIRAGDETSEHEQYAPSMLTHRAPVLAADGRPLREGEHVYHIETGAELVVKKLPKPGEYQAVVVFALPTSPASHLTSFDPDRLTHERPVLDADGSEIREKLDVWWICEGDERGVHAERLRVEAIGRDGLIECSPYNGGTWVYLEPSELYVNKPVPAADGKPLRDGETVWSTDSGTRYTVEKVTDELIPIKCCSEMGSTVSLHPSQLTHERPEVDSWERLEEDATVSPEAYCAKRGIDFSDVDGQHRVLDEVTERMARDLVRRAKKLAGVDND